MKSNFLKCELIGSSIGKNHNGEYPVTLSFQTFIGCGEDEELLNKLKELRAPIYVCAEKPRKPKRHKKAKISGSKVVKLIADDMMGSGERIEKCVEIPVSFSGGIGVINRSSDVKLTKEDLSFAFAILGLKKEPDSLPSPERFQQARIINMAIESGLATLCTGTGAVFPAMRDDVDIRAELLEFARQVKAMAISEACFNEMLEQHRKDTVQASPKISDSDPSSCPFCGGHTIHHLGDKSVKQADIVDCLDCGARIEEEEPNAALHKWEKRTPDPDFQEVKPSREALIDKFTKTHWVDNVGQAVSWRERELMKKAVLWAHGYKG